MNNELEIDFLISQLHKIKLNLKKAPFRQYLRSTLRQKLILSRNLYNEIVGKIKLHEDKIDNDHLNFLIKASRFEFTEISQILTGKLANCSGRLSFKSVVIAIIFKNRLVKLVKMVFNMKIATSIVQTYDGSADSLDAFVDAANLLKDYIAAGELPTAIRFLKTRLTGKARLGLAENLVTVEAIVDDVKARCSEQISPENILAKLKNTKQKGDTNSLCDEVDNLANKLKSIYVGQGIPDGVAKSMATKAGVDALINGTNSFETKLILKAGTFRTIQEAVQKVRENATNAQQNQQTNAQVMAYGSQRYNNFGRNNRGRRGNNRENYSNNSRDRNNSNYRGNNNNHRYQGRYQNRNNYNNGNSNNNTYNNNYSRGGRRDNRTRQTYTLQAEQQQQMGQNMAPLPYLIPQQQNPQQLMVPAGTPQQNLNFLCQGGQGPIPPQQYSQ